MQLDGLSENEKFRLICLLIYTAGISFQLTQKCEDSIIECTAYVDKNRNEKWFRQIWAGKSKKTLKISGSKNINKK